MATLSSRLESLERDSSECEVFGEMTPYTRALLARLRDPSLPMPCTSPAPSEAVTLLPHTRRFLDEMRAQWMAPEQKSTNQRKRPRGGRSKGSTAS
jgi:hypothetical protein